MVKHNYAALDYSRWSLHQRLLQRLASLMTRGLTRLQVEGLEHIPSAGPVVAATNHLSLLDVPLYFAIAPRRTICLISDNWKTKPVFGYLLARLAQVIFVTLRETETDRHKSNRQALAQSLTVLSAGGILALAPEGGRSPQGLKRGRPGIVYMANRGSAPILTAVMYGQEHARHYWKRARRVPIYIRFGPLIELPAQKLSVDELQHYTDLVMASLATLLPADYQGVYTENGGLRP